MTNSLSDLQKENLSKYIEVMTYKDCRFIFGPEPSKFFREARDVFHTIGVGFYGSYANPSTAQANDDKERILLFVENKQADKLIKVLAELTGKTYAELTNNQYKSNQETEDLV